ncbi:hypothetical protein NPIL_633661 [Nephila pilipes]|uniref:Uncharacterized protein n=1 Tax=Nephila pilipes TaxID=299642 RepID=A0A8X6PIP2_NEPPI|nr:hypothetical protein NPIL_633661 [Nephila pilipes]
MWNAPIVHKVASSLGAHAIRIQPPQFYSGAMTVHAARDDVQWPVTLPSPSRGMSMPFIRDNAPATAHHQNVLAISTRNSSPIRKYKESAVELSYLSRNPYMAAKQLSYAGTYRCIGELDSC